jgi:hypothetical protein
MRGHACVNNPLSSLSLHLVLPRRQLAPLPALSSSSQRTIVILRLPHGHYAGNSSPTFALSHIPRVLIYLLARRTQHYVWAGGHFILLISALRYILAWAFFKTPSLWWYKGSPLGFAEIPRHGLIMTCT